MGVITKSNQVSGFAFDDSNKISKHRGIARECNEVATRYPHLKRLLEMLLSIERKLNKVCGFRRGLFRRRIIAEVLCLVDFFVKNQSQALRFI